MWSRLLLLAKLGILLGIVPGTLALPASPGLTMASLPEDAYFTNDPRLTIRCLELEPQVPTVNWHDCQSAIQHLNESFPHSPWMSRQDWYILYHGDVPPPIPAPGRKPLKMPYTSFAPGIGENCAYTIDFKAYNRPTWPSDLREFDNDVEAIIKKCGPGGDTPEGYSGGSSSRAAGSVAYYVKLGARGTEPAEVGMNMGFDVPAR